MMRGMKSIALAALIVVASASLAPAAGLDVYLIRHAETLGNVTGNYTETNQCTFSPGGLEQVAGVAAQLASLHFDDILVSPTWRTRQTILPFLRANKLQAEIWPELEECPCDSTGEAPPAATIPTDKPIQIAEDDAPFFRLRDDDANLRFRTSTDAETVAQIHRAVELIQARYANSGKTILVVTHSCAGARLIENLLGVRQAGRFEVKNASLTHLRQEPDGSFRLLLFNDQPFVAKFYWKISEPETPVPGKPIAFSLVPKTVAQIGTNALRLEWRLENARRETVDGGTAEVRQPARQVEDLLDLSVATEGAARGDVWTLDAKVFAESNCIQNWAYSFLFPSYVSLAGPWKIRRGDTEDWATPSYSDSDWATTSVPGGWEKDALRDYDGTAWCRLHFTVSADARAVWGTAPLAILMGAIDDADETYLNGKKIGATGEFPPASVTAWDRPRVYEFDPALLAPTNVLAVRISDWGGGGGIWKGPVAVGPAAELRTAATIAK